jgi:putative component of membrane protein insertase Oxa1/YidC/SpoIIIJ protein YidD
MYLRDIETRTSCPLQTATRPHCSEFVVWPLEHKSSVKGNLRRYSSPEDVGFKGLILKIIRLYICVPYDSHNKQRLFP